MNKKTIIVLLVAIGLMYGVYWYFFQKKQEAKAPAAGGSGSTGTDWTKEPATFPLKLGSKGKQVARLQQYLGIPVDGVWGPQTQAAFVKERFIDPPKMMPEEFEMSERLYYQIYMIEPQK